MLGIKHKLHVRKICLAREKLLPLTQQEMRMKTVVEGEEQADKMRSEIGVPSLDTVFSQARNGRVKRVEESLNLGRTKRTLVATSDLHPFDFVAFACFFLFL